MPPEVLIVADDVTGALDSAVAFAARGMRVVTALSPELLSDAIALGADVVAVASNSRDLDESSARKALTGIRTAVAGYSGIVFKKVDSRLKGHIPVELDALSIPASRQIVACPAIPRLGRFVKDGAVCGAGVATPIPVAPRIGRPALVLDASSQSSLDAALPVTLADTVLVGAAGLAEALSRRLRPNHPPRPASPPPAPALLAIGSRDPVTRAQIAALRGVPVIPAPNGVVPGSRITGTSVVAMSQGRTQVPESAAAETFAQGIAELIVHSEFGTLFGCGGETAARILRQIGVGLLEVRGELLTGVPLSSAVDGPSQIEIVTKSGGFGAADVLVKLVDLLD